MVVLGTYGSMKVVPGPDGRRPTRHVLRSGSGHWGEVRGTFAELQGWIGPDARDWPLAGMPRQLEAAAEIEIHVLSTEAGANPAFVVSAWKQ